MTTTTTTLIKKETKGSKILNLLRERGNNGVTNAELSHISLRFGAFLGIFYQRGYKVLVEDIKNGFTRYTLLSEPKEEILSHEKAYDLLMRTIAEVGLVDSELLAELMDELGIHVKYKPYTYNKQGDNQ